MAQCDNIELLKEKLKKERGKSWGKELPEISQRTYDAVYEKFEAWKNETAVETV